MNGDLAQMENSFWSSLDLIFEEGDVVYETRRADEELRKIAELNDFSNEEMDTFIEAQEKRRANLLKMKSREEAKRQKARAEKFPQEGSW